MHMPQVPCASPGKSISRVLLQQALTTTALIALCAACATVDRFHSDPRIVESHDGMLGLSEAELFDLLGEAHTLLEDPARAEPLLARAVERQEAALGKNHPQVASLLNTLALLYQAQGLYARAEPLYERALKIRRETLGENHPQVASSLNNLALLYQARGLYTHSEPLFVRALQVREIALGESHPQVASSLNNLALLYQAQEIYARAEPLHERALKIREAAFGERHPDVASSLYNLALLYQAQGLYARAKPLYARALKIWEKTLGNNHPDVASSLHNLANLYQAQGLYARAEPLYARALKIREATLGENHPDVASSLHSLANLYNTQKLYTRAEPLYARALKIREATLGENHPDVASSLHSLANLYKTQGLYARAEPLYARALKIEAARGGHFSQVASSLTNLAGIYEAQGLYERAEALYELVLKLLEMALGDSHPLVASVLNNLASLHLAQQHLDAALPLLERAFTSTEQHLRQEVFGFSEQRLASFLHLHREQEERIYSLVRAYPHNLRIRHLALSASLLRKGRSLQEVASTSLIIYRNLGPSERQDFDRLRALRTEYSTLSLAGPGKLSPVDYQQRLKELAAHADALEEDLSRRSAPLRTLSALPPPAEAIDHVAKALPQDGALIEFVAYRDNPLIPKLGTPASQSPSQLRYLALLLFADGRTVALDLGPAEPIDTAAVRLHEALASQSVSYQPAAHAFYKLAFRPLVPHLAKVRRLFLSPDGLPALVPFAALHDGSRFLLDSWDITYFTSGKELLPRPEAISPARSVVVLADPDFDSPSAAHPVATRSSPVLADHPASLERFFSSRLVTEADSPFPPLPGTRREAETIQRLLPQAQVLLGPAATKHALLTLDTPGILHIGTHGFFLEDAAGPIQSLSDPLLRSGLVLAGASPQQVRPDSLHLMNSLVTALELAGLDLWGTQLVVLSACDTGRGDIMLGQDVYGLRRALMVAGAESLVTSLWKVNDEATRDLMESYYGNLLAGQGRAEALRAAMQALRQKHPHPYFWAPFILIGKDAPLQGLAPSLPAGPIP
jgi:CHAT domain-containing protein/Tfp pilus assembly protein PilF